MGWLADRYPKRNVMLLIYLLVATAIPFLFFGTSRLAIYTFAVIFGIGLGGDYMIIPLMTADIFGLKILGRLMGVILTAGGIADALSPWLIGHLRDASGSYRLACFVLVGFALLGALAVLPLPRHRKAT
jgi:MFS family permease